MLLVAIPVAIAVGVSALLLMWGKTKLQEVTIK